MNQYKDNLLNMYYLAEIAEKKGKHSYDYDYESIQKVA